jgi:hypothetical protein
MKAHSAPSARVFEDSNAWKVLTRFHRVMSDFSPDAGDRAFDAIRLDLDKSSKLLTHGAWSVGTFKTLLITSGALLPDDSPPFSKWKSDPETSYHDIVYQVVTWALGLSYHARKHAGLELVTRKDPPLVDFFMPLAETRHTSAGSRLRKWFRLNVTHCHRYTTLCIAADHAEALFAPRGCGCVLLEAEYVELGPPEVLEMAGIWVPRNTPGGFLQTVLEMGGELDSFVQWVSDNQWSRERGVGSLGGDQSSKRLLEEKWRACRLLP